MQVKFIESTENQIEIDKFPQIVINSQKELKKQ